MDGSKEPQHIRTQLLKELRCGPSEMASLSQYFDFDNTTEETLFSSFFYLISDVEMGEEEARYHYTKIITHRKNLEKELKRKVGFRVAMLDYLLNINPKLQCPKFIEISTYNTILSLTFLDSLTGLFNRRSFDNHIIKELNRSKRYGQPFSLILLDIDDFKAVNDNFGHPVGDSILRRFARILKDRLRSEDLAARYGGEEFILLLPQTDISGSKTFADRLLKKVRTGRFEKNIKITFSAGIASYPIHGYTKKELVEVADKAMYAAKSTGKNRITVLNEERRENKRYDLKAPLYFDTQHEEQCEAVLQNISLTGLAGATQKRLAPGQVITLHLYSTESQDDHYEVLAQIVWIDKTDSHTPVNFGVKYTTSNQKMLYKYILPILPANGGPDEDDQPSLF